MPLTPFTIVSGQVQADLHVHLSNAPIIYPYSLQNLPDVRWGAYSPSQFYVESSEWDEEMGFAQMQGYADFAYGGDPGAGKITAVYLVATVAVQNNLLYVWETGQGPLATVPVGDWRYAITIECCRQ